MTGWFFDAMEATWPPAATRDCGPFLLREGAGGGKRVSAATAESDWDDAALVAAEAAMKAPLFLIRPGDASLDAALEARGYGIVDPVVGYAAPVAMLAGEVPAVTGFAHWPPLEIARDIWAEGGIGPGRLAVMGRVAGPKAAILVRSGDRSAGVGFVACAGDQAMIHAVEVRQGLRRQGAARHMLRAAANWAAEQGAARLALAVTRQNLAARSLYESLGMVIVASYHYRAR